MTVYRLVMNGARKDDCTIDHLYSKLDERRHAAPGKPHEVVLACWQCNALRSHRENSAMSYQEKLDRSWRGYRLYTVMSPEQTDQLYRQAETASKSDGLIEGVSS